MPQCKHASLWELIAATGQAGQRFISNQHRRILFEELNDATTIDIDLEACRGRSVLIRTSSQLATALAVAELDGIARRMVLCPSGISNPDLFVISEQAEVEITLSDDDLAMGHHRASHARCGLQPYATRARPARTSITEWVLLTSGTTGRPKLAVHTLESLVGPALDRASENDGAVWATFYDIRRYGGLQMLLRAYIGGGSIMLSDSPLKLGDFLTAAGATGITHISGTPSHWRCALMTPALRHISPKYVRLSGEIVDQAILDQLKVAFPEAAITHAFASTEAGVGFEVNDARAGFPVSLVNDPNAKVEMRIVEDTLRIRSRRCATRYLGNDEHFSDADGFVDTGDQIALREDRYFFTGRKSSFVKIGGEKVHPEEVEAIINLHPAVRMSRVHARPSPITGAVLVASIVTNHDRSPGEEFATVRREILVACRSRLKAYKIPWIINKVTSLEISPSGKLSRSHA